MAGRFANRASVKFPALKPLALLRKKHPSLSRAVLDLGQKHKEMERLPNPAKADKSSSRAGFRAVGKPVLEKATGPKVASGRKNGHKNKG